MRGCTAPQPILQPSVSIGAALPVVCSCREREEHRKEAGPSVRVIHPFSLAADRQTQRWTRCFVYGCLGDAAVAADVAATVALVSIVVALPV